MANYATPWSRYWGPIVKTWTRYLISAYLAYGLTAATSAQPTSVSGLVPVRVAIVSRTVFYVPLWVAAQSGHFAKQGLAVEIEVFDNAEKIADALRTGSVQVAVSTPETVIVDAIAGGNLRIIAGNAERLPHYVIAKSNIKSPAQLKGAVFGVLSLNEGTTYLVHEYAKSVGLREGDYAIRQVGGAPTRWKLLQEGTIDAGLQPFPLSYEAEAAGFTNLGPLSAVVPEWQFTSVNVDSRWAKQNSSVVKAFLSALKQGTDEMQNDPELAVKIASRELKTTPERAARALSDTKALRILSLSLRPSEPGLRTVVASLIATGQVKAGTKFDMSTFVDFGYLP